MKRVFSAGALLALLAGPAYAVFVSLQKLTVTMMVSVAPAPGPVITLNAVPRSSGLIKDMRITGTVTDGGGGAGVSRVILRFKRTFDVDVSSLSVTYTLPASASFEFVVPPAFVSSEGVQYRVEAVNGAGVTASAPSAGFLTAQVSGYAQVLVGPAGGSLVIRDPDPATADTRVDIPAGALDHDELVSVEELSGVTSGGAPAAAPSAAPVTDGVRLSPFPAASFRMEPRGLRFAKPVTLRLAYADRDQDGFVDSDGSREADLKIFAQTPSGGWSVLGGSVDASANVVSARIFSFETFAAFPASPLSPEDFRPMQKVFTPGNHDSVNDTLDFGMLDPGTKVEIYSAVGGKVKSLSAPFQWDGRDETGRLVESGLYIYQYVKDGKMVSGAFAVAK